MIGRLAVSVVCVVCLLAACACLRLAADAVVQGGIYGEAADRHADRPAVHAQLWRQAYRKCGYAIIGAAVALALAFLAGLAVGARSIH